MRDREFVGRSAEGAEWMDATPTEGNLHLEPEDLGGETAGEADTRATDPFFVSKNAAAVLKHAVLEQYLVPFASKIGKYASDKRVVYVDGYAGPGRYADGTEGSPALVLSKAASVADYRTLECLFVERRRASFRCLGDLVSQAPGQGVRCAAYRGSVSKRLGDLLDLAGPSPLFIFLDPFGLGLSFTELTSKVLGGARGPGGAKTEVLLNFSANATRRIGGFLDPACTARNRDATLDAMNRVCGGDWWQDVYGMHETTEARVAAIATEYAARIAQATGAYSWVCAVRNRSTLQPVYHLVFFTRHSDGVWLFGDALARAQKKWRRVLDPPPGHVEGTLFDLQDPFEDEETRRAEQWKGELQSNIVRLLARNGDFTIRDRYVEVFGGTLGLATDTVVRKAVKELHRDGLTGCTGVGDVSKLRLTRMAS
jgi:three-Cys-motif partner protein